MDVRFVAGVGAIVEDVGRARRFYGGLLGLPLKFEEGSEYSEVDLPGLKHWGLWPLSGAAASALGQAEWPNDLPRPQANIELEVDDVRVATEELRSRGLLLLREATLEPWGQTTARLLSPEGLMISIVFTPGWREQATSS
jgi:catechol 2,3-dioxygenase-like lactoylglutathione lyase family enzyme